MLYDRVEQERMIHPKLQHTSIVKLITTFEDDQNYYLVLEYCEKGTLAKYLKLRGRLEEGEARDIIKQVLEGLLYLHSKNIIHRDLTLRNILLTKDMKIKIADFGLSTQLKSADEKKFTMVGTAQFMSPELTMGARSCHGKGVDIWALGCVLYALLVGTPPFDGRDIGEIFKKARKCDVKIPAFVSKVAAKLISDLMEKDPGCRIDLNGVLRSPFFAKCRTNSQGDQKFDSGISDLSLSATRKVRLSHRSLETDSGVSSTCNRGVNRSRSTSKDVPRLATIDSMSHSSHSNDQLPVRHDSNSYRSQGSAKQHENKFMVVPSRNEFHDPDTLEVSTGRGRERSASEERRKQERQRELNENQESFPRQSKKDIEKNTLLHNRHHDVQIRSRPQSPMAYPIERLENLIEENLLKSYSSCESGNPSKSNKSHEFLNSCKKRQHPVREHGNYSHHSLEHQPATDTKSREDYIGPPFNTARLHPFKQIINFAVFSLESDGQVCLEYLKTKKGKKYVSTACYFSADGMRISIQKKSPLCSEIYTKAQHFSYENLPKVHWKKYIHASRFVDSIKVKTPKITFFCNRAKAMLIMMENVPNPDFHMRFYNGGLIESITTKGSREIRVFNENGEVINRSDQDFEPMWEKYVTLKSRVEKLAEQLELLQENSEESIFPMTMGKQPSPVNDKGTPTSISSSIVNKPITNTQSYSHSVYSPDENSRSNTSCRSEMKNIENNCDQKHVSNKRPVFQKRSIDKILTNLTNLPKVVDGKILAEYKDGFQMWSTPTGKKIYFYDTKSDKRYDSVKPNSNLFARLCSDLKGILLHVHLEQRKNMR
ncbi:serine/threonine-protein kinase PLK4-like [Uloborus diversus]|uniref:serine/threonine-protein kinase PLK4-like n=1 Tax=Uloborus diversus TaxID=327109 RepID=UPI002409DEF4|nr:serine/threonine-protein kinase PLK4-like [Uloborus diversus]